MDQWDIRSKRVKGNSSEARKINNQIDQTRAQLYEIYQELKYKNELITAQLIKAKFNGEDDNSRTLQEILKYHNRKIKKPLHLEQSEIFACKPSAKSLLTKQSQGKLKRYLKSNEVM